MTICHRVFVCTLAVWAGLVGTNAQDNPARLDSIVPLLDPAKKDTMQLTMLILACESWTTSPKAYPYLERLDALSTELLAQDHPRVKARARHARGAYHFFTGYHAKFERNVPLALSSFQQAIRDFEEGDHQHAVGECLDALGLVYGLAGAKDKAEQGFRDELRIVRAIGHHFLQNQALVHLAGIHADRGEYDIAWTCLDSCVRGTPGDSCLVLNERARIRSIQERRADAMALLERSLQVAGRSSNAWDSLPAITPLIQLHYKEGQYGKGLSMALMCARLAERMGDATAQCGCINLVGDGYRFSGDPLNAARWYELGLALAERIGNVGVARELGDEGSMLYASSGLKEVYKLQGRTADALRMTERWSVLKDSVQRMNGREEVLSARFLEEALRDSLEQVAKERAQALEVAQQQQRDRSKLYVIIGVCITALVVALAFWSRARYMRRANAAILNAQQKLGESERAREASEVRTRIARDVHDQLGSDLTKLVLLSTEAKEVANSDTTDLQDITGDIERIAGEANRSLGDIVWSIDPHHDSLAGLTERVRSHCERMLKWSKVEHTIDCAHEGPDRSLDPATKRDIYLMLREALNNAVKYAKAKHIHVRFHSSATQVEFEVKDDGVGMEASARNGHGLNNLHHRAERLGGQLTAGSAPRSGTVITFEAALEPVAHV